MQIRKEEEMGMLMKEDFENLKNSRGEGGGIRRRGSEVNNQGI